jgi:tetratricopeptide (TPR) repeat protein
MQAELARNSQYLLEIHPRLAILFVSLATLASPGCSQKNSDYRGQSAKCASELASRAELFFRQGQLDEGIDTLLRAVEVNQGDAGRDLDFSTNSTLDSDKLSHGEQQLKQMLSDRPAMSACLKPGDRFWNFVVRQFAGGAGALIYWDSKNPKPFDSDILTDRNEAFIQARDRSSFSSEYDCDALWANVIFELYRAANTSDRMRLLGQMQGGKLSPDEYALEQMAIAERAKQQTRAFFLHFYAPMRVSAGATKLWPSEWYGYRFFTSKSEREKAWQRDLRWQHFISAYKIFWVASSAARANPELASRYLQEVKSQESQLSVGLRTILYCYLTVFHLQRRELGAAQEALDVAEQLWPNTAGVRSCRMQLMKASSRTSVVSLKPTLPDTPLLLAETARSQFKSGDATGAVESIFKAIELEPNDAGNRWNEHSQDVISQTLLHRGEQQLKSMLKDRPTMGLYMVAGDKLWNWAVRRFAGEGTGHLIEWNPSDPGRTDALCWRSHDGRSAEIQVRDLEGLEKATPIDKFSRYWAHTVFELYNLSVGAGSNLELLQEARESALTRDEFIVAELDQEMIAVQCTRMFYLKKFLPFMQAKGLVTNPQWWYGFTFFVDNDARLRHYKSLYHWNHFGSFYEQLRVLEGNDDLKRANDLQNEGKLREAMKIVDSVLDANPESTGALYLRGSLFLALGNTQAALVAFNKGLEFEEHHTALLYGRGQANVYLGRFEDALHDFTALVHAAPNQPVGYYGRARTILSAMQPDSTQLRKAVTDAERACELSRWKSSEYLELLLKAYSAVSDSDGVRKVQERLEQLKMKATGDKDARFRAVPWPDCGLVAYRNNPHQAGIAA